MGVAGALEPPVVEPHMPIESVELPAPPGYGRYAVNQTPAEPKYRLESTFTISSGCFGFRPIWRRKNQLEWPGVPRSRPAPTGEDLTRSLMDDDRAADVLRAPFVVHRLI